MRDASKGCRGAQLRGQRWWSHQRPNHGREGGGGGYGCGTRRRTRGLAREEGRQSSLDISTGLGGRNGRYLAYDYTRRRITADTTSERRPSRLDTHPGRKGTSRGCCGDWRLTMDTTRGPSNALGTRSSGLEGYVVYGYTRRRIAADTTSERRPPRDTNPGRKGTSSGCCGVWRLTTDTKRGPSAALDARSSGLDGAGGTKAGDRR